MITVIGQELENALKKMKKCVTFSQMGGRPVHLTISGNQMKLEVYGRLMAMVCFIELESDGVTIPVQVDLSSLLKACPTTSAKIRIDVTDDFNVRISSAGGIIDIQGEDPKHFSPFCPPDYSSFKMDAAELKSALRLTIPFSAQQSTDHSREKVYFWCTEGMTRVITADRHISSAYVIKTLPESFEIGQCCAKVLSALLTDQSVSVGVHADSVKFEIDEKTILYGNRNKYILLDFDKQYTKIPPAADSDIVVFDRDDMLKAIKEISVFVTKDINKISLNLHENKISLNLHENKDYIDYNKRDVIFLSPVVEAAGKPQLECAYSGDKKTIFCNPHYVKHILSAFPSKTVEMVFYGKLLPLVIRPVGDMYDKYTNLLMQMKG